MIVSDGLILSNTETGDWQFHMFDISLVFYPVGMVCLVTMVFPVSLVSVHNLPFAQFLGFPNASLEGFSALFYFEQP